VGQESEFFNQIFQIIYLGSFLFFMVYGQKFQTWMMLREIAGAVIRLRNMKNDARRLAIDTVKADGGGNLDPTPRIDQILEYFMLMPKNLDPAGIVPKIQHVVDVREKRFENEINILAPSVSEARANNIEGVLEVALGLNTIYRIVNHFYLLGKKTMSLYTIMQIQMQLPLIVQMAEAYSAAVKAFAEGQPIGDSAGALVAAEFMHGYAYREVAKETVVSTVPFDGRTLQVLKAKGPGSTVGKPGEAIKQVLEENEGNIAMVIMVDAAGKLEGETSGETSEGVGAIIGGIGVDAYIIEEISSKYKIPVHAIAIKESIQEAIAPITKEIFDGIDIAVARVKRVIHEGTQEGDIILVAGIGNTVGIGQ
jgi:hypothetical protein